MWRILTTPLFLLRCMEVGIRIPDLDLLTIGLVNEIFIEKSRDGQTFAMEASQDDMDKF